MTEEISIKKEYLIRLLELAKEIDAEFHDEVDYETDAKNKIDHLLGYISALEEMIK